MKNKILILFCTILMSVSCAPNLTKISRYPKLYKEKPVSIVVMPPINQSSMVDAKDYFYTTLYRPLCEKGYYVYSPFLTMELFQTESAYDSEMFFDKDLRIFHKVLGADAAMFTIIKSWNKNAVGGNLTVRVEYVLRSTHSGETLYQREGLIKLNTNMSGIGGGGLLGVLVDAAATAATTALTDMIEAGRKCTAFILSDMPVGKYSPLHLKDKQQKAGEKFIRKNI